jgi:hypothetical protein
MARDTSRRPVRAADRARRWAATLAGLLTATAVLLLIITGNTDAIAPVAALGVAVTGGTAIKINIHLR